MFIGDFNKVLGTDEKFGGNHVSQTRVREFKYMLDSCNLLDLGFEGPCFTYCRNRDNSPLILYVSTAPCVIVSGETPTQKLLFFTFLELVLTMHRFYSSWTLIFP